MVLSRTGFANVFSYNATFPVGMKRLPNPTKQTRYIKFRIILVVLTPLIASALLSTWLISGFSHHQLTSQSNHYGQAIADQLAITSIDYLVSDDILSLNVVLDDLLARHNFNFAAIYDPDNNLLAQSGKHSSSEDSFTGDISFEVSSLGHVLIELDSNQSQGKFTIILAVSIGLHCLIALMTLGLIWFYGDLVYLWVTTPPGKVRLKNKETNIPALTKPSTNNRSMLVVKIKPARLVPVEGISKACSLYSGQLETLSNEEWLLTFDKSDQLLSSIRCGLLIREIIRLQPGNLYFKGGVDSSAVEELPMLHKHASYLASVSDENLLVSQRVNQKIQDQHLSGNVKSQEFHSSLTADGEVYYVEIDDSLLERQAVQLSS